MTEQPSCMSTGTLRFYDTAMWGEETKISLPIQIVVEKNLPAVWLHLMLSAAAWEFSGNFHFLCQSNSNSVHLVWRLCGLHIIILQIKEATSETLAHLKKYFWGEKFLNSCLCGVLGSLALCGCAGSVQDS